MGVSQTGVGQIASSVRTSSDTAVACDPVASTTGYFTGDVVTLIANPIANLISWGGACASAGAAPTCTVTMDAAKTVTVSFKEGQSVTFGLAPKLAVGGTGTVTATGGASGNPITFATSTPSVCSVTGSTVKALAAGDCIVTADQAGNANYTAAPQATQTITIAPTGIALLPGWNLLGNASDQALAVAAVFADKAIVNTVWKWDTATTGWQFFTPTLPAADLLAYATGKNYAVLSAINPGEGFWVNVSAKAKTTVPAFSGAPFYLGVSQLVQGWNLVATADNITPAAFNLSLTDPLAPPPAVGGVPINITTLWAWDNPMSKWYFYSPSLQGQGGSALFDYTAGKGYLDFATTGKLLGAGMGFWVNKP